jgi:hypothetical protein
LGMDFNQKRQVFAAEILHSHCWNPDLPWSQRHDGLLDSQWFPWDGPDRRKNTVEKHLAECDIIIYSWFMSIYHLVI